MQIRSWGRRWKMGGLIALAALACLSIDSPAWAQCSRGGSMGTGYGSTGMNPMMAMQMQRMQAMQQQMYAMQQQIAMMQQQQGGGGPSGGSGPGYGSPGMRGGQFGPPNQVAQDEGGPQMRRGRRPPPQHVARGRTKPPKTAVASKKPSKKSKVTSPSDATVAQRD